MGYIKPQDVVYRDVKVIEVLYDGGAKPSIRPYAIAIIERHGNQMLAFRWNGSIDKPIGFPSLGKTPTWCVLPKEIVDGSIKDLLFNHVYRTKKEDTI